MKFAPIVPIAYLDLIRDRDYHLALPHLVLGSSEYATAYRNAGGFKILDNGAAEGQLAKDDDLFRAAEIISATEIVVPDVLGDWQATARMVGEFAEVAKKHPKYSYMAVVQGSDPGEVMSCFMYYQTQPWITRVAFPRHLIDLHRGFRSALAESLMEQLHESFPNGVHALGANAFIKEPIMLASIPGGNPVVGMDTSLPAVLAIEGIDLSQATEYVSRQEDFFTTERSSEVFSLMKSNIITYSWMCR